MHDVWAGVGLLLSGDTLLWVVAGITAGFFLGVVPGLSGPNSVAILLPFSIFLSSVNALVLMAGVYAGSAFGASIPGILMNIPGNAEAAAAAQDGYPLTKQGKAQLAIGVSRMASVLGGSFSALVCIAIIGPLGSISLKFGPRELFVITLFGMLVISTVVGVPRWKGLVTGALGLVLGAVGASPVNAETRFTLGQPPLYEGIPFVAAVIGIFAIPQMLELIESNPRLQPQVARAKFRETWSRVRAATAGLGSYGDVKEGVVTTLRHRMCVARSTALGVIIGLIPGLGAAVGNFMAYALAKRMSKRPQEFGHGTPEGIIAPESCDNAITSATLVPTMTLGIPGGTTAALMLAALSLHGVQPGPEVMAHHAVDVYAVLWSMLVGALLILPLGIVCAAPMSLVTKVPVRILAPIVLMLCVVGTYSLHNSMFEVGVCLAFGGVGYLMRHAGYPVVPLVIGLILGPLLESNLMRSLELGNGSVSYFVGSPTAIILWAGFVIVGLLPAIGALRRRRRPQNTAPATSGTRQGVGKDRTGD